MQRPKPMGRIRRPTTEEIQALAAQEYMHVTPEEAETFRVLMDGLLAALDRLDELPPPRLPLTWRERDPGYRPSPEEDPYNIYIRKCLVKGASSGPLAGKRVGLKDNVCVAGIPMTHGSRVLAGYVPEIDATVVTRLLDAGAVIVGKLNQDDFAMGGTGETSAFGAVRNPRNPEHSAGGSSTGSGAALAAGEVDLAIGADQRGSGRIPAAWCGVVSIKATHGLVPSFGVIGMDHTVDHVCPMARTVAETALGLEVIAGHDPKDPQWVRGEIRTDRYTQAVGRGVKGIRIGLLREAFEWSASDPEVNEAVREAAQGLGKKGAVVKEVSLPLLKDAEAIWNGILIHSMSALFESDLEGYWRGGYCNVGLQAGFGAARRTRADEFSPFTKVRLILGKYLRRQYMSTYFGKAQNLRMVLRDETDRLLGEVDALAMPTTPQKPFKLLDKVDPIALVTRAPSMTVNTSFTDITGHPSLSVPCGPAGGLPVGLQLVGRHWEESLLFAIAAAVEADQK